MAPYNWDLLHSPEREMNNFDLLRLQGELKQQEQQEAEEQQRLESLFQRARRGEVDETTFPADRSAPILRERQVGRFMVREALPPSSSSQHEDRSHIRRAPPSAEEFSELDSYQVGRFTVAPVPAETRTEGRFLVATVPAEDDLPVDEAETPAEAPATRRVGRFTVDTIPAEDDFSDDEAETPAEAPVTRRVGRFTVTSTPSEDDFSDDEAETPAEAPVTRRVGRFTVTTTPSEDDASEDETSLEEPITRRVGRFTVDTIPAEDDSSGYESPLEEPPVFARSSRSSYSSNSRSLSSLDSAIELIEEDLEALKEYEQTLKRELSEFGMKTKKVDSKEHAKAYAALEAELKEIDKTIKEMEAWIDSDSRRSFEAANVEVLSERREARDPESSALVDALLVDRKPAKKYEAQQAALNQLRETRKTTSSLTFASALAKANHLFLSKLPPIEEVLRHIGHHVSTNMRAVLENRYIPNTDRLGEGSFGTVTLDNFGEESLARKGVKGHRTATLRDVQDSIRKEAKLGLLVNSRFVMKPAMVSPNEEVYFPFAETGDLLHRSEQALFDHNKLTRALYATARGLEDLHAAGIVHRDIKPDNLFICDSGMCQDVRVGDLGLAEYERDLTESSMQGTVGYIAPEVFDDHQRTTTKTDIFAFGQTVYRLLTGTLPFPEGPRADAKDLVWTIRELSKEGKALEMFREQTDLESSQKQLDEALDLKNQIENQIANEGETEELTKQLKECEENIEDLQFDVETKKERRARTLKLDPSSRLQDLMFRCLSPNPENRPTATDLVRELQTIAEDLGVDYLAE